MFETHAYLIATAQRVNYRRINSMYTPRVSGSIACRLTIESTQAYSAILIVVLHVRIKTEP